MRNLTISELKSVFGGSLSLSSIAVTGNAPPLTVITTEPNGSVHRSSPMFLLLARSHPMILN